MEKLFGTCTAIEEAKHTAIRRNFFVTLLIFLAVFYIATLFTAFLLFFPQYFYFLGDADMQAALNDPSATTDSIFAATTAAILVMPEWLLVCSLFATVSTIFVPIVFCKKFEARSLFTMGFVKKDWLKEYGFGLLAGLLLISITFFLSVALGGIEFIGFNKDVSPWMLLLFFLGYVVQGMGEEVMIRGYLMVSLANVSKNYIAVFVSALVFTILHLGNDNLSLIALLNLFLFGVLAAVCFLRRGSIWAISAIHSMWNFAQGNIFGCAVSGSDSGSTLFFSSPIESGALFGGNGFGPEGGLCATAVLCVGIGLLFIMKPKQVEVPVFVMNGKRFWKKQSNVDFS